MPPGIADLIEENPSTDVPRGRSGEPSPREIALAPAQPSLDRWVLAASVQFTICLVWTTPTESRARDFTTGGMEKPLARRTQPHPSLGSQLLG